MSVNKTSFRGGKMTTEDNNMSSEEIKKRERQPNWTADQSLLLTSLVEENKDIIKGKFSNKITHESKRQVWVKIATAINAAYPSFKRNAEQCEKRWYAVQTKERRTLSAYNKDLTGTGKDLQPLLLFSFVY